jgi:hypothetical protein
VIAEADVEDAVHREVAELPEDEVVELREGQRQLWYDLNSPASRNKKSNLS